MALFFLSFDPSSRSSTMSSDGIIFRTMHSLLISKSNPRTFPSPSKKCVYFWRSSSGPFSLFLQHAGKFDILDRIARPALHFSFQFPTIDAFDDDVDVLSALLVKATGRGAAIIQARKASRRSAYLICKRSNTKS